eukprot:Sspe_Gene.94373::Locus_66764_Transcript_1_2_Confidence_0.667_Length_735::g.94373::m.94373
MMSAKVMVLLVLVVGVSGECKATCSGECKVVVTKMFTARTGTEYCKGLLRFPKLEVPREFPCAETTKEPYISTPTVCGEHFGHVVCYREGWCAIKREMVVVKETCDCPSCEKTGCGEAEGCDSSTGKCVPVTCAAKNVCGEGEICVPHSRHCSGPPCPQYRCEKNT